MLAKKDGEGHESVRVAAKLAMIRMCLNGETLLESNPIILI